MGELESFALRAMGILAGLFAVAFLGAGLVDGITPELLMCPVLAMLSYAAFSIDRQLRMQRRAARRARRGRAWRVVRVGGPRRAA